jgi:hypothetical protein
VTVAIPRHYRLEPSRFVERVRERAARVQLRPLLLSLAALPFVALGRFAYGLVATTRWMVAAVMTGYDDARGPRAG